MNYNYILGSGLISLICRKILGDKWKIIPLSPSRFYSSGVPAFGDDFIIHDDHVLEAIKNWGLNTSPIFYKRPFSSAGTLLYNNMFADDYFNKIGININDQTRDYYKTDFTVYSFSCLQLWNKLVAEYVNEIKSFYQDHENAKSIKRINDHKVILDNKQELEYNKLISTVPSYVLDELMEIQSGGEFKDIYYYFIEDSGVDIEKADQVLICDHKIPFHKCTRIRNNHYIFEVIDKYYDNVYDLFGPIIGTGFDVKDAKLINSAHVLPKRIDDKFFDSHDIFCVGSYAQCDPLMDVSSCIKRIVNLANRAAVKS